MAPILPDAADADSPLKADELQVLRAQYEKEGYYVGVQTKFNYAWGLIKSSSRNEQQEGVRLLSDIFRNAPERRRECLYYLALGNYKLGNYAEARRYNDLLLDHEPGNLQASSLRTLVDDKVAKEVAATLAAAGILWTNMTMIQDMIEMISTTLKLTQTDYHITRYTTSIPGRDIAKAQTRETLSTLNGTQVQAYISVEHLTAHRLQAPTFRDNGEMILLARYSKACSMHNRHSTHRAEEVQDQMDSSLCLLHRLTIEPLGSHLSRHTTIPAVMCRAMDPETPSLQQQESGHHQRTKAQLIWKSVNQTPSPSNNPPGGAASAFPGLHSLFASVFNPANAAQGDVVYTQEALDRIISQFMDAHNGSSAPGPATAQAISALPKKSVTKEMLGSDGKAECSVCMDNVELGDEVTVLPCGHWFHGECVGAWLKEHDTCPHCRQGIMPKHDSANGEAPTQPRAPGQEPRNMQFPPPSPTDPEPDDFSVPDGVTGSVEESKREKEE
ncbi:MAG: hypothetical protein Q9212_005388 [Teloschistes hypoglaucus]